MMIARDEWYLEAQLGAGVWRKEIPSFSKSNELQFDESALLLSYTSRNYQYH